MTRLLFRGAACALFAVLLVLLVSIAPPEAGAGSCYTATTYATQTYATPVYAVSYIPLQIPTYSTGYAPNPNDALEKEVKGLREELKAIVKQQQPAPPVQAPQAMPPGPGYYPPQNGYLYPPAGFQQGYQQQYQQPYGYPPQQQAGYYAPQAPPYGYPQQSPPQQAPQQPGPQDQLPPPAKDGGPSLSYLQVFNARCASCHDAGNAKEKGNGFVITEGGALTKNLDIKGVLRIAARCYDGTMPPSKMGRPLNDQEVGAVMAWVSAIR